MDKTGGLAFPLQHTVADANDPAFKIGHKGMTLRDYFAAKAMEGFIAAWGQHDVEDFNEIASDSYMLADAMLRKRDKQ